MSAGPKAEYSCVKTAQALRIASQIVATHVAQNPATYICGTSNISQTTSPWHTNHVAARETHSFCESGVHNGPEKQHTPFLSYATQIAPEQAEIRSAAETLFEMGSATNISLCKRRARVIERRHTTRRRSKMECQLPVNHGTKDNRKVKDVAKRVRPRVRALLRDCGLSNFEEAFENEGIRLPLDLQRVTAIVLRNMGMSVAQREKFKKVAGAKNLLCAVSTGEACSVWWGGDEKYYNGKLIKRGPYASQVRYDDGEEGLVANSEIIPCKTTAFWNLSTRKRF